MVEWLHMAKKFVSLCVAGAVLASIGAGCANPFAAKKPVSPPVPVQAQPSNNPSVIMFPPASAPVPSVNDELRAAFQNFHELKSFRSKFKMTSPDGPISGTLTFIRPDRFSGSMQIKETKSDLIVVGTSLYVRPEGAAWLDYSKTPASKTMSEQLRKSMDSGNTVENFGITDDTIIQKSHDDVNGCDEYKTVAKLANGQAVSLDVCVANRLPKYVHVEGSQGPSTMEYDKYNALMTIEKPL